ncbi:hypothetical protein Taro_022020 [Colocasia esculenta]|uniref:Uncharacterized protein n=1 Tax=Colocasia esculenta TaxID=4460 RepID=A0A843V766_COLES|nr:hypothetical protein [Colocasia esculenta]
MLLQTSSRKVLLKTPQMRMSTEAKEIGAVKTELQEMRSELGSLKHQVSNLSDFVRVQLFVPAPPAPTQFVPEAPVVGPSGPIIEEEVRPPGPSEEEVRPLGPSEEEVWPPGPSVAESGPSGSIEVEDVGTGPVESVAEPTGSHVLLVVGYYCYFYSCCCYVCNFVVSFLLLLWAPSLRRSESFHLLKSDVPHLSTADSGLSTDSVQIPRIGSGRTVTIDSHFLVVDIHLSEDKSYWARVLIPTFSQVIYSTRRRDIGICVLRDQPLRRLPLSCKLRIM